MQGVTLDQLREHVGGQAAGQPSAIRLHIHLLHNAIFHQHRIPGERNLIPQFEFTLINFKASL